MEIDWFTIIAQVVNFAILLFLLRYFLYRPVLTVMNQRAHKVTSRLEEAENKLKEAEHKSERYERELNEFADQKDEMMKNAKKQAEAKRKELIHEAREEVEVTKNRWMESVVSDRDHFLEELHDRTAEKIADIIDEIISDLSNKDLEEATVSKFLEKLKEQDRSELKQALRSALDYGDGPLKVITAYPLSEERKTRIEETIREVFDMELNCRFITSKTIGFGIELRTPGWKLSWNARNYLGDLRKQIDKLFEIESVPDKNQ